MHVWDQLLWLASPYLADLADKKGQKNISKQNDSQRSRNALERCAWPLSSQCCCAKFVLQLNFEKILKIQMISWNLHHHQNAKKQKFEMNALIGFHISGRVYVIDPQLNNCKIAPTMISNIWWVFYHLIWTLTVRWASCYWRRPGRRHSSTCFVTGL